MAEIASLTKVNKEVRELRVKKKILQDILEQTIAKGGNKVGGMTSSKAILDPDKFSSTTELEFNRQLSRIKKKINSDLTNYSTNSRKITYIQSRIISRVDNLTCYHFDKESKKRY